MGWPEVIFGEKKSASQIVGICRNLIEARQDLLVTRVDGEKAQEILALIPELNHSELGRTLSYRFSTRKPRFSRPIVVVTAGTSDMDVAEEAVETLQVFGEAAERIYDVGVAGIHRLFEKMPVLENAPAIICCAGMEGALPSVLGGLVRCPLVAVPTSVGYGAALGGLTALLGMLTGCASGLSVVNIDNGFGAAMNVLRMASLLDQAATR
jgi:NCAIR mutase (PurE)-related protein